MNIDTKNVVTIQISDHIFWGFKQVFTRNYINNISVNELSNQINLNLCNFLEQHNLLNLLQHVPKFFHFHDTTENIIYACTSCFNTINTLYINNNDNSLYNQPQNLNTQQQNNQDIQQQSDNQNIY